jgi:chromosomal replication initiation ATPase DnaA
MQSPFADFVPTGGSRRALAAVRALLEDDGPRLVLLHGPTGVGKSHLLRIAGLQAGERSRGTIAADFIRELLDGRSVRADEHLLTVDDLHVLAGMPASQLEVARGLEARARSGLRVLAAAGAGPDLPELAGQLRRFDAAELVAVTPPTAREMAQILLFHATRAGLELDDRRVGELAARCRGDVRLAQGAVARLRLRRSLAEANYWAGSSS